MVLQVVELVARIDRIELMTRTSKKAFRLLRSEI